MQRPQLVHLAFALAILSAPDARTQTPTQRTSVPGLVDAGWRSGLFGSMGGAASVPGIALSPDGRMLLAAWRNGQAASGWYVSVLRHENLAKDSTGRAVFPTTGSNTAWSPPVRVAESLRTSTARSNTIQNSLYRPDGSTSLPMWECKWMTMVPDPNFRHLPCPYPSTVSGQYDPSAPPNTPAYATYCMLVVAADEWKVSDSSPTNYVAPALSYAPAWVDPEISGNGTRLVHPIGRRTLKVVVSAPNTPAAAIVAVSGGVTVTTTGTAFEILEFNDSSASRPLLGIEPTMSIDGRLLVFHSHPDNAEQSAESNESKLGHLMYSYNSVPGARTGWSKPKNLCLIYNDGNTLVDGVELAKRYPLARAPLREADGTLLNHDIRGAYPWLTLDGADLTFTTTTATPSLPANGDRTFGVSMIGASTRWRVRHLDGPINPSRSGGNAERRRMLTGTGPIPGAWAWGGQGPRPLPYTPTKRSIPLFSAGGRMEYAEVDTTAGIDADVLVALDMNETVRMQHLTASPPWFDWMMQFDRTPNTGDLGGVATLLGGATFTATGAESPATPVYYDRGVVGECVTIKGTGHIEFTHPGINAALPQATVAGWVRMSPDTHGWRTLIRKLGSFAIEARWISDAANAEVRVSCTLNIGGVPPVVATLGVAPNTWTHVALVFDGTTNPARISLALDGTECAVINVQGAGLHLAASTNPLQFGPVGTAFPATAEMRVDQFRFDRVARTRAEIAQLAYVTPPPPSTTPNLPPWFATALSAIRSTTGATLPVFPAGSTLNQPLTPGAVDLGRDLFADTDLDPDGAMACASCHVPSKFFTDGNVRGIDRNGQQQLRNVPTVLDRLWGRSHFLDGRRNDLETLVLDPLFHPTELASSQDYIVSHLAASPYATRFSTVYGSAPSLPLLQHALASYMRALVSMQSTADKFEGGTTTLVGSARRGRDLFFGRARCATCHSGPNWSDEEFHVSPIATTDRGRFAVTGRLHDDFRFRTPSLRNISLTAPYFHNGKAATLQEVVEIYRTGGQHPSHRDEEIFPLDLSDTDASDLVTFLHTLASGWTKL